MYADGFRNIWQYTDCAKNDPELIYVPRKGECVFENIEFKTKLTFDSNGRLQTPQKLLNKKGIAVVGDSFAMGWGVNDKDTYSNILQERLKIPVFNLGVSSYGTFRELKSLVKSDLLEKIDIILINYVNNDLEENVAMISKNFDIKKKSEQYQMFIHEYNKNTFFKTLSTFPIWRAPKQVVKNIFNSNTEPKPLDFNNHLDKFRSVIEFFNDKIKNKKIVVFYTNEQGRKFLNFPNGQDSKIKNLFFYDLNLGYNLFFKLDDHISIKGHKEIADKLSIILKNNNNDNLSGI